MRDYLNVLEIAELPPAQRKIMRLILRKVEMTYVELCSAVDAMPEADRLSRAELDQGLAILQANSWVITARKGDSASYRVNLRRESVEAQDLKGRQSDMWNKLMPGDENAGISGKGDTSDA